MKKFLFPALMLLMLTVSSCVKSGDIEINGVSYVPAGGKTITLILDVENTSGKNVHVKDGNMTIGNGKVSLVKLKADDFTIPRKSSGEIIITLTYSLNQMGLLSALGDLQNNPKKMLVSGDVKVRAGLAGKKFSVQNMPLGELLDELDIDIALDKLKF